MTSTLIHSHHEVNGYFLYVRVRQLGLVVQYFSVSMITDDNGGDDFVREKKALHFGIRQLSVPYCDDEEATEPSGVEMIQSIDCEQGVDTSGLRYKKPITSGLDMADFLSMQELEVLQKDLDENTAAWLRVSTALVTK
jgi:hypothetical protein